MTKENARILSVVGVICAHFTIFFFWELMLDRYIDIWFIVLMWLIPVTTFGWWRASRRNYLLCIVLALLLTLFHFARWSPRKAFLLTFHSVKKGDTKEEVLAKMSKFHHGDPIPPPPPGYGPSDGKSRYGGQDVEMFWHSSTGEYNSDIGVVFFQEGQVAARIFYPD